MKKLSAFTMIELIFVIIIMGILGKFGVEFLAKAYKSFMFSSINNELQANSASAVEFISSRLQHRIKDSVIARVNKGDTAPVSMGSIVDGTDYLVMEWVGTDNEGYLGHTYAGGEYLPTWSGILDLDAGNANSLVSPGTNTNDINNTIKNLSNSKSNISDIALYFIGSNSDVMKGYGWDGNLTLVNAQQGTMHPVTKTGTPTNFTSTTGTNFSGVDVYEYYKLAWTAYAIINEEVDGKRVLKLYWNYQPWLGERYDTAGINVQSATIMENVSSFRFISIGSIIKIQVCAKSDLIVEETYSLCKEKTIF